jgi:hypothetical protein
MTWLAVATLIWYVLSTCDQSAMERAGETTRVGEAKLVREGDDTRVN